MTQIEAKTTDIQLIEKTLNYYLDGLVNLKVESLVKSFQSTATMKSIQDSYEEVNAVEALTEYINTSAKVKIKTNILAINVAKDAANAQLEMEYETFSFIDFLHLLKIEGEWKIVSKTFTTIEKEF